MYSYFRLIYISSYPIAAIQQAFKKTVNSRLRDPVTDIFIAPYFEPAYQQYEFRIPFTPEVYQELYDFFNSSEVYLYIYRDILTPQVIEVNLP
jgi:hypothetical protein